MRMQIRSYLFNGMDESVYEWEWDFLERVWRHSCLLSFKQKTFIVTQASKNYMWEVKGKALAKNGDRVLIIIPPPTMPESGSTQIEP